MWQSALTFSQTSDITNTTIRYWFHDQTHSIVTVGTASGDSVHVTIMKMRLGIASGVSVHVTIMTMTLSCIGCFRTRYDHDNATRNCIGDSVHNTIITRMYAVDGNRRKSVRVNHLRRYMSQNASLIPVLYTCAIV